jgi:hypothetical protein
MKDGCIIGLGRLSIYKIFDFEAPLATSKFNIQADQCCDGILERTIGEQHLGW